MPPIRLGPNDFLEYNANYGVLICRDCEYAIQKSALQSHLLRHKIYREQRQRLLSSIAQLRLFEPDEVPIPEHVVPAIDALPVISGYRCKADGCGNLCASYKRMRRHRSEAHGLNEDDHDLTNIARPAKLQTFFRGTKIRYFEVTPGSSTTAGLPLLSHADDDGFAPGDEQLETHDDEEPDTQVLERPSPPSRATTSSFKIPPNTHSANIDLDVLTYFHHYTTVTSLTLPCVDPTQSAAEYWQTDVVLLALRERWLMCGLLAISAVHLAALAHDRDLEREHRERLSQLFPEFMTGWNDPTEDQKAMMAGEHIRRILRCTQDLIVPQLVTSPSGAPDDDVYAQGETFSFASRMLSAVGSPGTSMSSDPNLSAVLDRLGNLPTRMTAALGRPENTGDVLVILAAIAALIECYSASFGPPDAGLAWRGMECWLDKVPHRFLYMVSHHNAAALVVLAHWAATLVRRSEHCGCWFLRGSPEAILLHVEQQLLNSDHAVQSLVEGLR